MDDPIYDPDCRHAQWEDRDEDGGPFCVSCGISDAELCGCRHALHQAHFGIDRDMYHGATQVFCEACDKICAKALLKLEAT